MSEEEVPRCDVTHHLFRVILHHREAVVIRLFHGFDDVPDGSVSIDGDNVVGHVVLDPLLIHHDSVTLARHELFGRNSRGIGKND